MKKFALSGNQLKLIAAITMLIDHIGAYLFPQELTLRIIGRLAMPIYAFMIAEGCRHTRSMPRYLATLALTAAVCQIPTCLLGDTLYLNILVTFTLSVGLIYLLQYTRQKENPVYSLLPVLAFLLVVFLSETLPTLLPNTDLALDYRLPGVMLPVFIYLGKDRYTRLLYAACGMLLVCIAFGFVQWYCLLALPLLCLYSGQRGTWKLKWFFYLFYPGHLLLIQIIGYFL